MNYNFTKNKRTGSILTIIIITSFTIIIILPHANGQQSTRNLLQDLESHGKTNCFVWQINDFLYKPVRISLTHETANTPQVKITSEDPASKVFWDGSKESFQLVTDSTDRHTVELNLDYAVKHDQPRQVFYQVFAKDRTLMMEGNWVSKGDTFCIVIDFWTQEAPHILTAEEIQEQNNKFNSDFRAEVASQSTTTQNGLIILSIVVVVSAILSVVFFISVILTQRSLGKVADKPVKKLNEVIEKIRRTDDVMELTTNSILKNDKEFREQSMTKIDNALTDLSTVVLLAQQKFEIPIKVHETKTSTPMPDSTTTPVKIEIDEKQEMVNEQTYQEEYGIKSQQSQKEQPKKGKPSDEMEVNLIEIKLCLICKRTSEFYCYDCKQMFCYKHNRHRCKNNEVKMLTKNDLLKTIKQRIIKSIMEKKQSIFTDDAILMKELEHGRKRKDLEDELVAGYMKIPYNDAKKIYEGMNKDFEKNKTFAKTIRIGAMLARLVKSSR